MPEVQEQEPKKDEQPQQPKEGEAEEKKSAPASKSVVGIIYPPPEVRNIVDKTADFVARIGPEFEDRIRINEAGNPKFNFLKPGDPYNAYYQHKIKEIREGVAQESQAAAPVAKQQAPAPMVTEPEVPKDPPPEWQFMVDPPSISARHLNIVKLTAMFVARNGAQFMDQLMMREQKNEMFDFLRKNHILFAYFIKLVEQYTKVLMPSKEMLQELERDVEYPLGVLEKVNKRVAWVKHQEREKQRAEEEAEKERVEYAQIDWHDFVIVETISFREDEAGYLPPPIHPSQLAARLLQQQKYERMQQDEGGEVEEIEMEVEEATVEEHPEREPEAPPSPPRPPAAPPLPSASGSGASGVQIRRDYNPKLRGPAPPTTPSQPQQLLVSPITGEKVPQEKLQEHMKHALLDPRWKEVQKKQIEEKQQQEEVYAEGFQIGSHLKQLAGRRTDIFGVEETVIGKKIGEEENKPPPPQVQWDGHAATADIIRQKAQSRVTVEEQIEHIQRVQGLLSDPEKEKIGPQTAIGGKVPPPPLHRPIGGIVPPPPQKPPPPMGMPRPPPISPQPLMNMPTSTAPNPIQQPMPPPPPQFQSQRPLLPTPSLSGLIPPVNLPTLLQPGLAAPPPIPHPAPPVEPPPPKKPRAEEELVSEQDFISRNPGPVTFTVQVPSIPDRPEWRLNGQTLSISLPITDPVSVIKAKIADELGMPTGKQKLQIGAMFIKDSNSLGFYNMTPATCVLLGLKERGGRKK